MGNSNPSHGYTMSNVPLTTTAAEKDLGLMGNELKFHKIEKVQRATKLISTLQHDPYEAQLWSLSRL